MNLEELLYSTYGFSSFRPGQKEIIEQVIAGEDVIALLPTGMGKSICYQLPAKILPDSVLIVSPLLSLMQDQVAQLKKMGEKSVVAINSFLKPEDKDRIMNNLGAYKFIFISPEMLVQPFIKKKLQEIRVSLLVADEAHCISQWGFDFRPDYLRISEILPILNFPQVLALTATATDKVTEEIKEYLALIKPFVYCHPMDRKNIVYDIKKFEDSQEKLEFLKAFIQKFKGPGIIYAGTRKKSQELSMLLTEQGISAAYYHGGMEHQDRVFVQQQFQNGEVEWICSTNAFGMGVHIPNIRQVIHFQIPTSIEGYVQEVGRAGRDGFPALATLLYATGDEALLESLVMDDLPTQHEIEAVFNNGPSATHLIDQGVVRETAFRVIAYWMTKLPLAGVTSQIEQLRKGKRQQASKIRELVSREGCLRSYIIGCFDQQLTHKPDNCCVNDGIDYGVFEAFSYSEKKPIPLDWQERLSVILPI
ncbi:ATP-dependent DNA helicase recQ [Planococcus donghaensis MPA1U2]|uniref:ATP-dependent DNA helicase recQ n=1 Tax=Planococcus donghaensis MPA1U2 TaxID=933115 RepID=E7RHB3_9BACL|nr:ATP-dependent DNA helicase RecQ [Planococcus donghaensis]EGA89618.1 ATP-dependent DNA helicase recQ [Planococcus donghaensis MPA1U2]